MTSNYIELINIKKTLVSATNKFILGPLSLNIQQKSIIAVVGLNGAGKTTLIKLLLGLLAVDSGKINFNKISRKKIGYFPENFSGIGSALKVNDMLRFFSELNRIPQNNIAEKIEISLKTTDVWEQRHKYFKNLSKGMKTRVGLAQALLGDPAALILDEPTDGLDPQGKIEIREMLKKLRREDKTILLSSHNLSEVESIADRIIILHKGKILVNNTIDAIKSENRGDISLEDFFIGKIGE